jgi:hypothetical protein
MRSITVKLHPPLLRYFPANKNSIALARIQRMVSVVVYVFGHPENSISCICRTLKTFLKNRFVPPHPNVPTCHHKNYSPLFTMGVIQLIVDVFEDPIPTIKRRKK